MDFIASCGDLARHDQRGRHLFRARGLRRVGAGGGVEGEQIRVHEVPLSEADAWLAARAAGGTPVAIKVYAGLYWAR
jgi:ADP-ribose pyrophosphatase